MEPKLAFLGAGNMAEALARGLVAKGVRSPGAILASDIRPAAQIPWLGEVKVAVASNLEAVRAASTVVLAVKPKDMPALLAELRQGLQPGELESKLFVSIAAGLPLALLEAGLGAPQSHPRLVRVMPNTPALVGQGASAYCLGRHARPEDGREVESVLGAVGTVCRIASEADMDAVTALSGSGPAYLFYFLECLQAAGAGLGLSPELSYGLAVQTLKGATEMASRQPDVESVAELRRKVTSPGGTTEAALKSLAEAGFQSMIEAALKAARDRGQAMGLQAKGK